MVKATLSPCSFKHFFKMRLSLGLFREKQRSLFYWFTFVKDTNLFIATLNLSFKKWQSVFAWGNLQKTGKKLPESEIIFAVPKVLKIKPPNNIKNFRLLIPEYLWLWKPPLKMDIQRPILTAFCRQRIECALKRIGYQEYECKGPKLLIESINQIRKNFLTNQFQWGFF